MSVPFSTTRTPHLPPTWSWNHFNPLPDLRNPPPKRILPLPTSVATPPVKTSPKTSATPRLVSIPKDRAAPRPSMVAQQIPRVIYQTFRSDRVTPQMLGRVKSWWDKNPEYSYRFYTDTDCHEMILEHLGPRVANAYHSLIPGAFRADLWRYCVLYINGGVYLDLPMWCNQPLGEVIDEGVNLMVVRDTPSEPFYLYNAMIASVAGHPALRRAIEICVIHIESRWYGNGHQCLDITGPGAFGSAVNQALGRNQRSPFQLGITELDKMRIQVLDHQLGGRVVWNNSLVSETKYPDYGSDRALIAGHHYWEYYVKRQVYRVNLPRSVEAQKTAPREQNIPRTIYQTFDEVGVTPNIFRASTSWRQRNPSYRYLFYDTNARLDFLQSHFGDRVVKAYQKLIPSRYREDLWRYCLLYEWGGVYVGIDTSCVVDLSQIISQTDSCVVCVESGKTNYLNNALIACVPKHPLLLRAYEMVVQHTEESYYGDTESDLCSGKILADALSFLLMNVEGPVYQEGILRHQDLAIKLLRYDTRDQNIYSGSKLLVATSYQGFEGERLSLLGDGVDDWASRGIYRSV